MACATDIATYIQAANIGWTLQQNLFCQQLPATPDVATMVATFPMGPTVRSMSARIAEPLGLQIQTRALTRAEAETACYQLYTLLDGIRNQTLSGTLYFGVSGKQSPKAFAVDNSGSVPRIVWMCELSVLKTL